MSEVDSINAVLAAHVRAVNSGDVEANLDGFADDQVYMPPGSPPIRGKGELETLIRASGRQFDVSIEMAPEETIVSGDWAFQWGFLKGAMRSRKTSTCTPMDWKFLYVYKRQADGRWKIARDMYNSNSSERVQ